MTEIEYKEAERFYEKFKETKGFNYLEGLYDLLEVMVEYSKSQNDRLTDLIDNHLFSKKDLSDAWHHGSVRAPRDLMHLNNFDDYFKARYEKAKDKD